MFSTFLIFFLNGLANGMLLFLIAAGLTLIFGVMGVLNFAHGSLYMLGASVQDKKREMKSKIGFHQKYYNLSKPYESI